MPACCSRALPDGCLERIFVLFPDPWPKTRHHKRRIVNPATAAEFARLLAPGGELRLATDDMGYARAMLLALLPVRPSWSGWPGARRTGACGRPTGPPTRYEQKARRPAGACVYLRFRRRGHSGEKTLKPGLSRAHITGTDNHRNRSRMVGFRPTFLLAWTRSGRSPS